jgi:hypothetical protein
MEDRDPFFNRSYVGEHPHMLKGKERQKQMNNLAKSRKAPRNDMMVKNAFNRYC